MLWATPFQLDAYVYVILQVKFEKGVQIVKIFKEHASKTSILDDFGFYESREKTTQERKFKEQQLPKQVTVVLNLFHCL